MFGIKRLCQVLLAITVIMIILMNASSAIAKPTVLNFPFLFPLNLKEEEIITGHIDIIQVNNGMIHIMGFKPSARKAKPV